MEYECHSLQLSKIHRDKTKAHHDVINKRRTRINVLTTIQKYMVIEQGQYTCHNLKEYSE